MFGIILTELVILYKFFQRTISAQLLAFFICEYYIKILIVCVCHV